MAQIGTEEGIPVAQTLSYQLQALGVYISESDAAISNAADGVNPYVLGLAVAAGIVVAAVAGAPTAATVGTVAIIAEGVSAFFDILDIAVSRVWTQLDTCQLAV